MYNIHSCEYETQVDNQQVCAFFPDSDHGVSLPALSSVVAGTSAAEEDSNKDAPTNKASSNLMLSNTKLTAGANESISYSSPRYLLNFPDG